MYDYFGKIKFYCGSNISYHANVKFNKNHAIRFDLVIKKF